MENKSLFSVLLLKKENSYLMLLDFPTLLVYTLVAISY